MGSHGLLLPVLTGPVPCRHLAGRLAVTSMPSPEATSAVWVGLLNCHLWVTVSDGL